MPTENPSCDEIASDLPPCDSETFHKGVSVCLVDIPKDRAEHICQSLSAATGIKIDWHYIGGRVHIKALTKSVEQYQNADSLTFKLIHPFTREQATVTVSKADVVDGMEDTLYEKLTAQFCQCEPVGETNVVDCNCDEYCHDFDLVADDESAGREVRP